jgi:hypothetical protein
MIASTSFCVRFAIEGSVGVAGVSDGVSRLDLLCKVADEVDEEADSKVRESRSLSRMYVLVRSSTEPLARRDGRLLGQRMSAGRFLEWHVWRRGAFVGNAHDEDVVEGGFCAGSNSNQYGGDEK